MAQQTAIEWTDVSWNPIHGCSKVSPGCAHCYAETLSRRFRQTPRPWTPANAAENVLLKPHKLREPLSWRKPRMVFVNSMSDLFHEQVPDDYIDAVFGVMAQARAHTFQVLTKRPERMCEWINRVPSLTASAYTPGAFTFTPDQWPLPNVWLGVSIENRRYVHRADLLRKTPAAVRFISAEPLLGPLLRPMTDGGFRAWTCARPTPDLDLTGIDWLIVGGESGAGHRPVEPQWVRDLRDACTSEMARRAHGDLPGRLNPAFFFKQWGGRTPKAGGRELDGREWNEMPSWPSIEPPEVAA